MEGAGGEKEGRDGVFEMCGGEGGRGEAVMGRVDEMAPRCRGAVYVDVKLVGATSRKWHGTLFKNKIK